MAVRGLPYQMARGRGQQPFPADMPQMNPTSGLWHGLNRQRTAVALQEVGRLRRKISRNAEMIKKSDHNGCILGKK